MQAEKYYGLNEWSRKLVDGFVVDQRFSIVIPKEVFASSSIDDNSRDSVNPRMAVEFKFRGDKSAQYKLTSRKTKRRLVKRKLVDEIKSIFIMDKKPSYKLYEYTLPDGTKLTEFVQVAEFTSGPIYFMALRDSNGQVVQESLWDYDELDNLVKRAFKR